MNTQIKIAVIIESEGKILLIKEKYQKKERPLWNVIKGSYGDNGDENIFETAIRECQEEASVKVDLTGSLGVYISKKDDQIRIQFNFLARIIEGEPKIAPMNEQEARDEFIQEIKWFTKEEFLNLNKEEFISGRIHELVKDWTRGKKYSLEVCKQVLL